MPPEAEILKLPVARTGFIDNSPLWGRQGKPDLDATMAWKGNHSLVCGSSRTVNIDELLSVGLTTGKPVTVEMPYQLQSNGVDPMPNTLIYLRFAHMDHRLAPLGAAGPGNLGGSYGQSGPDHSVHKIDGGP